MNISVKESSSSVASPNVGNVLCVVKPGSSSQSRTSEPCWKHFPPFASINQLRRVDSCDDLGGGNFATWDAGVDCQNVLNIDTRLDVPCNSRLSFESKYIDSLQDNGKLTIQYHFISQFF